MESSPLMDAHRFARNVESAYQCMWRRWCGKVDSISMEKIPPAALEHHSAGRWTDAETIYRQILQREPHHSEALHLLGLIAAQTGRAPLAVEMISQAIVADDRVPGYHSNLGVVLQNIGRLDEAIRAYHRAISLDPGVAEAYNNLGNSLRLKGDIDQAIKAFHRAVELKPDFAQAHGNLGTLLMEKGDPDGAISSLRRALELNPSLALFHTNLGAALADKEMFDEAVRSHRRALEIDPQYAQAYNNLGNVLMRQGQSHEGIAAIRRAIEINPKYPVAHYNLGNALREVGRLEEAAISYDQAKQLNPEYADAHFNSALTLLALGDFQRGWPEHAWRIRAQPRFLFPITKIKKPLWDGGELNGQVIFIHAEQGFGDTIQFVRYVPMVAKRGGRVILGVQPEMTSLLETFSGVEKMLTTRDPLPDFDLHCPLLSLPAAFSTDFDSIPATIPYLTPGRERVESWKSRITSERKNLRVGLVWAGSPKHVLDRDRSIPLRLFAALREVSEIEFFSLQKGEAAEQVSSSGFKLIDHTADLHDFADTAALMANLDLVIAVDTAVAHLAGAMGIPVWVLLPFVPDWRWLMKREDSPWYPTMRLFRQSAAGDWDSVIRNVARALTRQAQESRS
jgi:tetratricopeptide (TPR) repeat protein